MSKSLHLHARIASVLDARFPNNEIALGHFGPLLIEYVDAEIGPPHLVTELENW